VATSSTLLLPTVNMPVPYHTLILPVTVTLAIDFVIHPMNTDHNP